MRIWKIISGILSIGIGVFAAYQSFFAGLLDAITGSGRVSGVAGAAVAVLLLIGGIVSIASSGGSMGADCVLIALYGIGSLVGFTLAGDYTDLIVWAFWCLLCACLALVDFVLLYTEDSPEYYRPEPSDGEEPGVPPLRSLIFEKNPKKRSAAIDGLPEQEAKGYLKQLLTAFINREEVRPPEFDTEDRRPGRTALTVILSVAGTAAVGAALFMVLGPGRGSAPPPGATPGMAAVSQAPAPSPSTAPATPIGPDGPAGSGILGEHYVEVKGACLTEDRQGAPAIVITCAWTNNSQETTNAMVALSQRAFQDGVQIDAAAMGSDNPSYEAGSILKNVRPGAATDIQLAFLLTSTTAPVEFEIYGFLDSSGEMVSASFDLTALDAPD